MPKKKQQRIHTLKRTKKKLSLRRIFLFIPLLLFVFIVGSWSIWYASRAVPDLGDESQTTIPSDVRHVLGATLTATPEITIRIPIFLYHYVENVTNDPGKQKLNIPPATLTAQIETLKQAGYTFITPNDLTNGLSGQRLPNKVAMLSFDDGYMDLYTDVFPILQKEHVKAVAYIVPNLLDRPNYLFTFQLKQLAKSPLIEIGAHTMDHYALAGMNTQEATYEIAQSRKVLQNMLNVPVNSFAYPYGSFDLVTIQIVKSAGFNNAVSVIPGIIQTNDNEYFLSRLRPGYRTGQALLDLLKQDTFQPW